MLTLLAAEAGEAPSNPILPEWSEMFWGAIFFTILFLLVKYVFLPPIKQVMDDREAAIRSELAAAEAAQSKAGSADADLADQLSGPRAEAASIIEAARAEADAERASIIGAAEAEVAEMKAAAAAELAAAKADALGQVTPKVADMAASAASKVLGTTVASAAAKPAVDAYLNSQN